MNYKQYRQRSEEGGPREYVPSLGKDLMRHMQTVTEEGNADAESFAQQLLESDEAEVETLRAEFIREFGRHKVGIFDELAEEGSLRTEDIMPGSRKEMSVIDWIGDTWDEDDDDRDVADEALHAIMKYGIDDDLLNDKFLRATGARGRRVEQHLAILNKVISFIEDL